MAEVVKNDFFQMFMNKRNSLIDDLENGKISKKTYVSMNIKAMEELNVRPFDKIDSFEKGMYNYYYYNMVAKNYYMEAMDIKETEGETRHFKSFLDESKYYYSLKDKSTLKFLKHLKFKNMSAYYIEMNSQGLQGKLYEIHLEDYDKAILHSKNFKLRDELKQKGVFKKEMRKSLIDDYVNTEY